MSMPGGAETALDPTNPIHTFAGFVLMNRDKPPNGLMIQANFGVPMSILFRQSPGSSNAVKFTYRLENGNMLIIESSSTRHATVASFSVESEVILSTLFPDPSLFEIRFQNNHGKTTITCMLKDQTIMSNKMVLGLCCMSSYLISSNAIKTDVFLRALQYFHTQTTPSVQGQEVVTTLGLPLVQTDFIPPETVTVQAYADPIETSVKQIYDEFIAITEHLTLDAPTLSGHIQNLVRDIDLAWNGKFRNAQKQYPRILVSVLNTAMRNRPSLWHALMENLFFERRDFILNHADIPNLTKTCIRLLENDRKLKLCKDTKRIMLDCLIVVMNELKMKYPDVVIQFENNGVMISGDMSSSGVPFTKYGIRLEKHAQVAQFSVYPFKRNEAFIKEITTSITNATHGMAIARDGRFEHYSMQLTVASRLINDKNFYKRFMDSRTLSNAVRAFIGELITFFKKTAYGVVPSLNQVGYAAALLRDDSGGPAFGGPAPISSRAIHAPGILLDDRGEPVLGGPGN